MNKNNLFEDKFDVFFKEVPDLTTNDNKNPTLVELQNLYYTCNQKLNNFEQEYHDRFLDLLFHIIFSPYITKFQSVILFLIID